MPPRLLALDLDGTLLRPDGTIHPDDAAAIGRLRERSVQVTIVTGRLYSGSVGIARRVGISGPIACVDGSQIVDVAGDRELLHSAIAGRCAETVREVLRGCAPTAFLLAGDGIVHERDGSEFVSYVRTWSERIEEVDRLLDHPAWRAERGVSAIVAVADEATIQRTAEGLAAEAGALLYVATFALRRPGGLHGMVVRAAGTSKGTAIGFLARHHALAPAEVVAVGDWLNDLPMFAVAGRSFAMGQSPEVVREAATDRLEASAATGGGVAEAIRRVWGV